MKSRAGAVGNINLRGRKSAALSCGCCDIYNFTDRERERQARQDIDEAIRCTYPLLCDGCWRFGECWIAC